MKNVLVLINGDAGQEHRLRAGIDLALAIGGHITCLTVTPDESTAGKVVAAIDGMLLIQDRLSREGVAWDWIQKPGRAASGLQGMAQYADMIVASGFGQGYRIADGVPDAPVEVFIHSNTLVILTPFEGVRLDLRGRVLVAWDGELSTLEAIRAAAPLLRLASQVEIVPCASQSARRSADFVVRHLVGSGINAEPQGDGGGPYEYIFVGGSRSRRLAQAVFAAGAGSPWSVTGMLSAVLH